MFEAIYGFVLVAIVLYLFCKRSDWNVVDTWGKNTKLADRIEKLEVETRYIADQPERQYSFLSYGMLDGEELERKLRENDVPIADVVKAIVKHLGIEILKDKETTVHKPMEVKIVEKPKMVMSATGVVTMADGSGIPMPKPKRKYTKRKPVVKTGGRKNA